MSAAGRLLTVRAFADLIGVEPETVLRWRRRGELPPDMAIKLPGGAIRIREDKIDGWYEERATPRRGVLTATPGATRPSTVHSTALTATEDEED